MNDLRPTEASLNRHENQKPFEENRNRYKLATYILIGYMLLILFAFASPFFVYKYIGLGGKADFSDKIVQILNAYMGALTGLTGLVGFIVGYYYKGKDDK